MDSTKQTDPSSDGLATSMLQTGLIIDKYYTPLLCLLGTLGNSLSLTVFCLDSKYRSQSSSYYLSALAVSDTGFLLNLFAVWLERVHGGVITSNIMCPLVMYLGQVTCFMSVYLTVAFSIERYVAVHYPFSRPRICTKSKAKKAIFAVTAVALLIFSYVWIIAKVIEIKPSTASSKIPRNDTSGNGEWATLAGFTTTASSYNIEDEDDINLVKNARSNPIANYNQIGDAETSGGEGTKRTIEFPQLLELTSSSSTTRELHGEEGNMIRITGPKNAYPFREMRNQQPSHNWNSSTNSSSSDRSIKLDLQSEMSHEDEQNGDHVQLVDGNNGLERQQQQQQQLSDQQMGIPVPLAAPLSSAQNANDNANISLTESTSSEIHQNISSTPTTKCTTISAEREPHTNEKKMFEEGCQYRCSVPKDYFKVSEIANYMDTVITLIVPFVLITYFNVRISISVWKFKDQRQQIVALPSSSIMVSNNKAVVGNSRAGGAHSSMTRVMNGHQYYQQDSVVDTVAGKRGPRDGHFEGDIDRNGACRWRFQEEQKGAGGGGGGGVRFEDISVGASPYANPATLNENRQLSLVGNGKPVIRGGNGGGLKREISIVHRGEQRATFQYHNQQSSEAKVTKTLLLVSTVFLVLNLPLHVIHCTQFIQSVTGTEEWKIILRALQPWANLLFNTNFAVNFLLYCASGRNFRKSLKRIGSRLLRKSSQPPLSSYSVSNHNHHQYQNDCPRQRGRTAFGKKWRWRRCSSSTTATEGTRSYYPTVTSVVHAPQATELENIASTTECEIEDDFDSKYLPDNIKEDAA